MAEGDWYDERLHLIGMFLSGSPLRSPGPRGEQLNDASFLLWLNAQDTDDQVQHPLNDWVSEGEVVLSTDPDLRLGTRVAAGGVLTVRSRSLVLLRGT
jgi:glycogen operon protein